MPSCISATPGLDDEGMLGEMRVKRALQTLNKTDVAVLVVDGTVGLSDLDRKLLEKFAQKEIPHVVVYNKSDLDGFSVPDGALAASAATGAGIHELKERIALLGRAEENPRKLVADLLAPNDLVVLCTPIDESAPKGRLILPQQQTIRDILDAGAAAVVAKDTELAATIAALGKAPKLVITDSQAFGKVAKIVPESLVLTSFSILFARYKGDLARAVAGAAQLDHLTDGDTVLISEGCTHHRQCGDIGTVKLPAWIRKYTGKELNFVFTSGGEFPEDLSQVALIVHCGGCMLNERAMRSRIRAAVDAGVPITNYGIAIAQIHGILRRSLEPFPEILQLLD